VHHNSSYLGTLLVAARVVCLHCSTQNLWYLQSVQMTWSHVTHLLLLLKVCWIMLIRNFLILHVISKALSVCTSAWRRKFIFAQTRNEGQVSERRFFGTRWRSQEQKNVKYYRMTVTADTANALCQVKGDLQQAIGMPLIFIGLPCIRGWSASD